MANPQPGALRFSANDEAASAKGKKTAKSASQELIASNRNRIAAVITNASAVDVWLALGSTAVAEEGIYLKAEGGSIVIDFYTGPISVITKSGEGLVTYAEV